LSLVHPNQVELGAITIKSLYICPPALPLRAVVYQTGPGTVDVADCNGPVPNGPAIGVVLSKPTGTSCYVVQQGLVPGFPPASFVPKTMLFMGAAGALVPSVALPLAVGTMIQGVGYAKTDTDIMVSLEVDYYFIE